jgi:Fanconi anemia group M protein
MKGGNTLVVLPTGLGKTLIALMLIEKKMESGRCMFLTPTKPLARQHYESVISTMELPEEEVALITGEITPKKRQEMYEKKVVIATPQTIRNDLDSGRCDPLFSLCIIDEAHRAVGDYAYVRIADRVKEDALIVGLTASPGGKKLRIQEVLDSLFIKNIEIRTHHDEDVAPYVQKSNMKIIPVMLSSRLKGIKAELDKMISKYTRALASMGFVPPIRNKGLFLALRERIMACRHGIKYAAIVQYSVLLNLLHLSELLETQGLYPMKKYLEKIKEKKSKSANLILREPGIARINQLADTDEDHPKMDVLLKQIKRIGDRKAIVFAQYRDQIARIVEMLQKNGISAKRFVGKKDGFTRKDQEKTIEDFRSGLFNVLCASSIGEEGLDIPAVDYVIFYEPIPSEIRSIQRRGRTARLKKGDIIVLMTKGTRDEAYAYASKRKEERMKTILMQMQKKLNKSKEKDDSEDSDEDSLDSEEKTKTKKSGKTAGKADKAKKGKKKTPNRKPGQSKISDFFG